MASSLKVILVIVCLLVILIGAERQWDIPEYERNIETFEPGIIVQTKLGKLEGIRVRTKYDINGKRFFSNINPLIVILDFWYLFVFICG